MVLFRTFTIIKHTKPRGATITKVLIHLKNAFYLLAMTKSFLLAW